ncbi:MAG: rod shape-determining protein MreC [Pseudomonadota bacterium]|nr:rod shape-determining protein MreC [Pseudomonadota bacterium]
MAVRKTRSAYILLPGKQWLNRAGLALLATAGLSLLLMSKAHNPAADRLRGAITDAAVPVLSVASRPLDVAYEIGAWIADLSRVHAENVVLRNQNIQLLQWQAAAKDLEAENASLRSLLKVVPAHKSDFVTAHMVSDIGGPYVRSALLAGGSDNGVRKDEAVVAESGLIGRIVNVGASSARVLLLSDINSRVPVIAEHAQEKAILAGNNGELPTLAYLPAGSRVEAGDRIVTSGDGGVFPKGVPVGVVVGQGSSLSVQLFADPAKAAYVSVVDTTF